MAEAVGLAASIIGIAELAAKIVKISFKVKGLLEQVSNVPQELQRHLDQIRLVSPLLASHINDDGPPALRGALGVAMMQCQQAADDLETIAEELHTQVHEGGRARRKLRAAGIVLQKDVLASHEKRLSSAMQMLMMACQMYGLEQQKYLIDLQKRQPDVIVAQILGSLQTPEATPTRSLPPTQPIQQSAGPATSRNYPNERRAVKWDHALGPHLNLGLTGLTGSLQVQNGSKVLGRQQNDDSSDLRIRVHLPRWFSSKYIDSIVRRSQAGWTYYVPSATLHSFDSETWKVVMKTMSSKTDSLQKLKSMIGEGQISLYDTRQYKDGRQQTLMEAEREDQLQYFQNVASRYADNATFFWALFQKYDGPITDFNAIRRAVWPDCEFYDESFLYERLELAATFTQDSPVVRIGSDWKNISSSQNSVVRALLYRNGEVFLPNIGPLLLEHHMPDDIISRLQRLLAWLSTNSLRRSTGISATSIRAPLLEDVVAHIVESLKSSGPEKQPSSPSPLPHSVYNCLFDISVLGHRHELGEGPLYSHISEIRAEGFFGNILRQYLAILSRCGQAPIPIQFVARKSTRLVTQEIQDVRTGARPEDWYIWFVGHTDEFVGDFWRLVDPAPMYIPGAWVDEE
ncbi:hypothetical protein PG985_001435 [Apiospora marii]|uniref:uncharacterized protein n=1 Tax=Apiospora marii TaxID=335849 RepID=UPI00312EB1EE